MKLLIFLFLAMMALSRARADDSFHAYASSTNLIEGGRVDLLVIVTSNQQATFRTPKGWYHQIDESRQKITFQSASGKSALTVQFTTNSPGALPPENLLRARVLAEHPGAGILQYSICPTSSGPGVFFDLVSLPAPRVILKMRHAFVALPGGQAEFILSANDDEFNKGRAVFMSMLNSFHVRPVKLKQ